MPDISDAQTYCCDRPECQVPVVLSALVTVGKEHWCRPCWQRLHPPIKDPVKVLHALYDFAFGAPEDAFTMPIEQVNAELREAGIDPDEVTRRVVDRLAEVGIVLKKETPSRDEVSEIEENETRTV